MGDETSMKKFITALPIVLLLSFSFVSFAFNFDHLVYFRLALGLFSLAGLFLLYKLKNGVRFFMEAGSCWPESPHMKNRFFPISSSAVSRSRWAT